MAPRVDALARKGVGARDGASDAASSELAKLPLTSLTW